MQADCRPKMHTVAEADPWVEIRGLTHNFRICISLESKLNRVGPVFINTLQAISLLPHNSVIKGIFKGQEVMPPMAIHRSPGNILPDVALAIYNCIP